MKNIKFIFFLLLMLLGCSFDNKTGIWTDEPKKQVSNPEDPESKDIGALKENKNFKLKCAFIKDREEFEACQTGIKKGLAGQKLELVFLEPKLFNEEKNVNLATKIKVDAPLKNINWLDTYLNKSNNASSFFYTNEKQKVFESGKLSKKHNKDSGLVYNGNYVSYDHNGTIYVYSPQIKKKIFEYNFYKKNYKRYDKKISLIIDNGTIYAADNLGYLYALDIEKQKFIWAQNYGIPFRSNIKIVNNQLILANQDNIIYSIDLKNGEKNWQLATSSTFLKSDFHNNILIDKSNDNIIFINTNGELYSINYSNQKINYMINFSNRSLSGGSDLFDGLPISLKNGNLIATTNNSLLNYSANTARRNWILQVSVETKPIITKNNIFFTTKNKLLVCLDLLTGEVVWSKKIYGQIKKIKESKKIAKIGYVNDIALSGIELLILTSEGYLLSFNFKNGKFNSLKKVSRNNIISKFIFADGKMYLINDKKKLVILN
jgi:outer membrane protein assembly factor BamB